MWSELLKYLTIYFLCTVKFIAGPTMGPVMGLSIAETIIITILGMMTSVLVFSFFGKVIREKLWVKLVKSPRKFTRKNRRFITIWNKYGIFGVSFLTPIIFSPIGGTILVSAMTGRSKRNKIFIYMLFSASFWSVLFANFFYLFL